MNATSNTHSPNRRIALRCVAAGMLLPTTSAFALDPVTAQAAISTAYSAASAAQEFMEKRNFSRWQSDVSGKLNSIHKNTEKILADLKQLRIDFSKSLDEAFRQSYEREVEATRRNLNSIIAGLASRTRLNTQEKARLVGQLDSLRKAVFILTQYGPAGLPFVLSGYSAALSVMTLVEANPLEISNYKEQMRVDFFRPAASTEIEGSYGAAAVVSRQNLDRHIQFHAERTGSYTVGIEFHPCGKEATPRVPSGECHIRYFTTEVAGLVTDPKSISISALATIELGAKPIAEWSRLSEQPSPSWAKDRRKDKPPPQSARAANELRKIISRRVVENSRAAEVERQRLQELTSILSVLDAINRDEWRT